MSLIASCVSALVILYGLVHKNHNPIDGTYTFLWFSLCYQFFYFSLGITAFFYFKNNHQLSRLNIIILCFIMLIIIVTFKYDQAIFLGMVFFGALIMSKYKMVILNNSFFQYLGKISFSLYLTQWWVFALLFKIPIIATLNWYITFPIMLACNVMFSSVTYYLIEKKFMTLGEKLIKVRLTKPQTV